MIPVNLKDTAVGELELFTNSDGHKQGYFKGREVCAMCNKPYYNKGDGLICVDCFERFSID